MWNSIILIGACLTLVNSASAQFRLDKHDAGVRIVQDEKVIAEYVTKSGSKPIIWPLLGPGGEKMTRDYPMVPDSKGEAHDHPHHRSLWFTHGEVNGIDFWAEGEKMGITQHDAFTRLEDGKTAVIGTTDTWKDVGGKAVLTDRRRFTFHADQEVRKFDCEFQLIASEGDIHFGDTKEGTFGLRVAETMKVDAKMGGRIINSQGQENGTAWGQPADWVDYQGPIGDKKMGIAILCHPSTFHYPNRWHVRTYGLFAANPFGTAHFLGAKEMTDGVRIKKGETLTFRYRVIFHYGDEQSAKIADEFKSFAALEFKPLDQ
ncbi:MAG: PmoA family protein [Pirellulales bacterium]